MKSSTGTSNLQILKARLQRLNHPLSRRARIIILAEVIFGLAAWLVLRWMILSPAVSAEWKLVLISLAALAFLIVGFSSLRMALEPQESRLKARSATMLVVLACAYLVPVLVFVLPDWLQALRAPVPGRINSAGQPWFFIWQALVLAGYAFLRRWSIPLPPQPARLEQPTQPSRPVAWPWVLAASLLAGLAVWLAGVYLIDLLSNTFVMDFPPLNPLFEGFVLLIALTAAPWAEEYFFRIELRSLLRPLGGDLYPALASAALFSALQARPVLFLPAFCLSLAAHRLTQWTGRLYPAVIAHALFNLLIFWQAWYLIL